MPPERSTVTPKDSTAEIRWSPPERSYFRMVYAATTSLGHAAETRLDEPFSTILGLESTQIEEDQTINPNLERGCQLASVKWLRTHQTSENALVVQTFGLEAPLSAHVALLLETGAVDWLNKREETKAAQLKTFQQKRKMTIIKNLEQLVREGRVEITAAREIVMELLPQVALSKKRMREITELWGIEIPEE